MSWVSRYLPPASNFWQGRSGLPDASCFFQIMQMLDLRHPGTLQSPAFALLGFQCDEGVSRNQGRTGAAQGPDALRTALAKLPVARESLLCYDAGNITCTDGDLEAAQQALGEAVALLLKAGLTPILIGGGHEIAWGHYQGIETTLGESTLGIINFDAHFDMRPLLSNQQGSSGTPFLQIANAHEHAKRRFDYNCIGIQRTGNIPLLFSTAKQHGVHMILAEALHEPDYYQSGPFIDRVLNDNDHIYLSLCLDVFATPYAPGVSAPQPLGVTPWQVIPLVRKLAHSGSVISYDIAELCPPFDDDQRTARLAAHLIYEITHHHTF